MENDLKRRLKRNSRYLRTIWEHIELNRSMHPFNKKFQISIET